MQAYLYPFKYLTNTLRFILMCQTKLIRCLICQICPDTTSHMVRNHRDGYPYINLALFFFFWKYPETSIYLVKMIGRWIPDGEGRGIARNIFLNIIFFSNFTKKVTMLGPFKRPEYREGSGKKLHFFSFFEKIQRFHFFW